MMLQSNKFIAGLTGGMGCGKSTVLKMLAELNWLCLDADKICHQIYYEEKDYLAFQFSERWNDYFLDETGQLARHKVARIVFGSKSELEWLHGILHPMIFNRAAACIENSSECFVVFDIPLLFEVGWEKYFNLNIAVWAPEEKQLQMLIDRGHSLEDIRLRLSCQLPAAEKLERADYGLINAASIDDLRKQCINLDKKIRVDYDRRKKE